MKEFIKKSFLILLILSVFCTSFVFAKEDVSYQYNNENIETVGKTENSEKNEEEKSVPTTEFIIEDNKDEKSLDKDTRIPNMNSGIATIAEGITSVDSNFTTKTLSDGTLSITGYKGDVDILKIPSQINNKNVTEIAAQAFYNMTTLDKVVIPATVKTIGDYAFYYSHNLNDVTLNSGLITIGNSAFRYTSIYSITIPNTVKTIGTYAFYDCFLSNTLTIPDSVETIGNCAFADNYGLTKISLGKNLSSLGTNVFYENPKIESYSVNSENKNFSVENDVLFNKNKSELILYPSAKADTTYQIPSSVKKIKETAFYGNKKITEITMPDNLTEIETGAFVNCTSLKKVTLNKNLKSIPDYAFNNTGIEDINIPASVTSLNSIAFIGTATLKNINIDPNNSVYKSDNGIVFSKDGTKLLMYPRGKTDASYAIPDTVKSIGESAFIDANVTSVTIPNGVTSLGDWCFSRSKLTSIVLPSSITSMGNGSFVECKDMVSAKIDANVKVLPYESFFKCEKLKEVTFNNNIEEISNLAFALCTSLESITLPESLKRIEYGFEKCSGIKSVVIPAGVEHISESSFDESTNIDISKTKLKKLDNGAYAIIYDVYLTGTFYYDKAKEVFDQLNQYRQEKGLSTLTLDQDLFAAAMERAKETGLYFDHGRPNGTMCYTACSKMDAENIAAGSSTSTGAMNQWKNSPGHNSNMLNASWKSVGIGCYCTNGVYYWVQCFSSEAGNSQNVIPNNKTEKQKIQTLDDKIDFYYRDSKDISLFEGETTNLGNIYTVNTGWELVITLLEKESMQYTSSNTSVATVDNNGKITAVGKGKTVIKASIGSKSLDINLTVNKNIPDYGKKVITAIEKEGTNYTMNVLMSSNNPSNGNANILTRKKVVELLQAKCKQNGIVSKIYKTDGRTEITKDTEQVGTGYKVKLSDGNELTVVMYGDVNEDGMIDTSDTVYIAEYNVRRRTLDKYQIKAAKLTDDSENVDTNDTVRVAYYNVNNLKTDKTGKAILDMQLYPEDYLGE